MDPDPISVCDPLPSLHLGSRIAERWRGWREHRRWVREIRQAAPLDRLDTLLNDIALTRAELDTLIDGPADAGRQFDALAAAEHRDLHGVDPAVRREAMWRCMRCECRAACRRWLRTGVFEYDGDPRCPNAALLQR